MKLDIKKNILKKAALILALLSLSVLVLSSCTSTEYMDEVAEACVKWTMSEDKLKLYADNGKEYSLLETDETLVIAPTTEYEYHNSVYSDNGLEVMMICAPNADSEYVYYYEDGGAYLYATKQGLADIIAFDKGEMDPIYIAMNEEKQGSYVDKSLMSAIILEVAEGEKLMYDVKTLRDVERYTVYRYDKNECLRFDTATLYRIDGHWYALDYSALENNNFDADGKLSYRSGNVYLVRLSDDTNRRVVWTFSEIQSFNCEYSHESDKIYAELREQENEDNAVVYTISFYFFFVILGFIVPIPFMVLGFVLPMIKKLGKPKYWYVISVLAFLWMVVALVLLILTFL